jgi:hypothetical protein
MLLFLECLRIAEENRHNYKYRVAGMQIDDKTVRIENICK